MLRRLLLLAVISTTLAIVATATWRDAHPPMPPMMRSAPVLSTTRAELAATAARMEARLVSQPTDGNAVVQLAEVLIRQQRVNSDAGAVIIAERRLRDFLERTPGHYEAQRMLGSVLLSQHRFRDAIREAERARAMAPRDAFNYGVIGDAHLELGEYDQAFAAFDRMGSLRPGPPAYARVAYALELQGDLPGAFESMRMAADGTSSHDAEGQAWHYAQLGNLLLQQGRLGDAKREFERATYTFPAHPYAMVGLARVKIAESDFTGALAMYDRMYRESPTPELAFVIGDLQARLGRADVAEKMYVEGERLERDGWSREEAQPQALARFLAERKRKIPEAIALAETAASRRRDVQTLDALAWAYYQGGRIDAAYRASAEALRTGTRDARVLTHAATIRREKGEIDAARTLLERASAPNPEFVLVDRG